MPSRPLPPQIRCAADPTLAARRGAAGGAGKYYAEGSETTPSAAALDAQVALSTRTGTQTHRRNGTQGTWPQGTDARTARTLRSVCARSSPASPPLLVGTKSPVQGAKT